MSCFFRVRKQVFFSLWQSLTLQNNTVLFRVSPCLIIFATVYFITVSHISLYIFQCGRSCSPNFMFTWPNAIVGMMEKTQLVQSILQVCTFTDIKVAY